MDRLGEARRHIFVGAAKVGGIAFNSASCLAMQPA